MHACIDYLYILWAMENPAPWLHETPEPIQPKNAFCAILMWSSICAALCIGGLHTWLAQCIEHQEKKNAVWKNKIKAQKQQGDDKQILDDKIEILSQLTANRAQNAKLLTHLVPLVPEGLYLTSFNRIGAQILIEGVAQSHAQVMLFMHNLGTAPEVHAPQLDLMQKEESIIVFHIHAAVSNA